MSRIGKLPVAIPSNVEVKLDGQDLSVKGPKGTLALTLVEDVTASQGEDGITIKPRDETKRARAMWGMSRALVANLVHYRAQMQGSSLKLALGFSHDVIYDPPEGIQIASSKPTEIIITGADKQQVGQVAAEIRRFRAPEPYKGKGVRYAGEYIRRKEGKKK